MITSSLIPNYGVNLYIALAMGVMKNMGLVLPDLTNFQAKQSKKFQIFMQNITIFNIGKHLKLFKIWFGTYNIGLQVCKLWPKIKSFASNLCLSKLVPA